MEVSEQDIRKANEMGEERRKGQAGGESFKGGEGYYDFIGGWEGSLNLVRREAAPCTAQALVKVMLLLALCSLLTLLMWAAGDLGCG